MRFLYLLLLLVTTNAFATRQETISADCLKIQDGVCVTKTELGNVSGSTSNLQTQINANTTAVAGKQATITGAATTITTSNLSSNKVMTTDSAGKAAASATVDTTELGYVDGATSNIQSQLNTNATNIGSNTGRITALEGYDKVLEFVNFAGFPGSGATATLYLDKTLNKLYRWDGAAYALVGDGTGTGDVVGPASATDTAIPVYNGTTGKLIKNSVVTINASGDVSANSISAPLTTTTSTLSGVILNNSTVKASSGANLDLDTVTSTNAINLKKKVVFQGRKLHTTVDDASTGSNVTLADHQVSAVRLTGAGLVSVDGIPAGNGADTRTIVNLTGSDITINNDTGATTANRFYTGTGADLTVKNNSAIQVTYDQGISRWIVSSGAGGAGGDPGILTNSNFDSGVTGWTLAAGTTSSDTADKVGGNKSLVVSLTAQALSLFQDSSVNAAAFNGKIQGLGYIYVKPSVSMTDLVLCARQAAATQTALCTNPQVVVANQWNFLKMPFLLSATSSGLIVKTTATYTATVKFSKAWLGAQDVKTDSQGRRLLGTLLMSGCTSNFATSSTTYANMGTNTSCTYTTTGIVQAPTTQVAGFKLSSVPAGTLEVIAISAFGKSASTTNGDVAFRVQDITNSVNGQDNLVQISSGAGQAFSTPQVRGTLQYASGKDVSSFEIYGKTTTATSTFAAIFNQSSANGNTSQPGLYFEIWSTGNYSTYSSNNSDTDWIDFTPTGAWTTNTTYTGKYKRDRSDAIIQYKLALAGAPNVANMDLNLPSGLLIDANKMLNVGGTGSALIESGGVINDISAANFDVYAIYLGTTSSVRVSYRAVSGAIVQQASVNATAPMTWAVGDSMTLTIRVPIQGWDNSNGITGSFNETPTTRGSNGSDIQSVFFGTGATCGTQCSTGTCTVCNQIGTKITSVTWSATGTYRLNGIDGTKYNCTGTGVGAAFYPLFHDRNSSTSTYAVVSPGTSTAANSAYNSVICFGIP